MTGFPLECRSNARPARQKTNSVIILDSSDDDDDGPVVTSQDHSRQPAKKQRTTPETPCNGNPDLDEQPDPIASVAAEDDTSCIVCGRTDNGAEMLLCDGCDSAGAHHMKCLQPPLDSPPEGDWFCPDCIKDKEETQGRQLHENAFGLLSSIIVSADPCCHQTRA